MEEFRYRLEQVEAQTSKHKRDLYEGNGKPALTVRMAMAEDCVTRIEKKLSWQTGTAAVLILTVLGDIIVRLVK